MTWVITSHAAIEPAATPKSAGHTAQQTIFQAIGRKQPAAGRSQRLEDDRVIDAMVMARGQRAGENQRRREQVSQGWRRGCASTRLATIAADRVDRILDPHGGDLRKGARDVFEQRRFLLQRRAARIAERRDMRVRRAAECVRRIDQHEIDAEALPVDGRADWRYWR